jgi:hypothetical protein
VIRVTVGPCTYLIRVNCTRYYPGLYLYIFMFGLYLLQTYHAFVQTVTISAHFHLSHCVVYIFLPLPVLIYFLIFVLKSPSNIMNHILVQCCIKLFSFFLISYFCWCICINYICVVEMSFNPSS